MGRLKGTGECDCSFVYRNRCGVISQTFVRKGRGISYREGEKSVERYIGADQIILLFEKYTSRSQLLYESMVKAGYSCVPFVIEENDFLPKEIFPIYDLITGDFKRKFARNPRFFNEIEAPDNWNISAGINEKYGRISYQHEEKGRIYYAESEKQFSVKAVEWYDKKGVPRFRDHYNRYGINCARTFYDGKGKAISKSWLSAEGKEIIVENYVTGDIILNDDNIMKLFRTKIDLIIYYFNKYGIGQNRIFFNSLASPFEIANRLQNSRKRDVLFWQESIEDEIPESMQMILDGRSTRTEKIIVQKRDAYDKLLKLCEKREMIQELGYIYPFEKQNNHKQEALICTNSEAIEHGRELINAFSQMHFHIVALTLMSPNLMNLKEHGNVSLYPGISMQKLDELFQTCDYYFDINHWDEIASAVYKAFLHNQLIFSFQETVHNREFVADVHVYPISDFESMVADIKKVMEDDILMEQHLKIQREHAMAESKETYTRVVD